MLLTSYLLKVEVIPVWLMERIGLVGVIPVWLVERIGLVEVISV
jgi:hypothetical protein